MVERRMCDVCGVRPAVVTVRRKVSGEDPRTEYLCEIHAAEARGGRSLFGGGSLFDDFFGRFFDEEASGGRTGGTAPRSQAEQVDITQFFSDSTSELLQRAAQQAVEWGNPDLTTEHLLYAALQDNVVRRVLEGPDADPEAIRAQLDAHYGASHPLMLDVDRAIRFYEFKRRVAREKAWTCTRWIARWPRRRLAWAAFVRGRISGAT